MLFNSIWYEWNGFLKIAVKKSVLLSHKYDKNEFSSMKSHYLYNLASIAYNAFKLRLTYIAIKCDGLSAVQLTISR